jgi:hypothetical protein
MEDVQLINAPVEEADQIEGERFTARVAHLANVIGPLCSDQPILVVVCAIGTVLSLVLEQVPDQQRRDLVKTFTKTLREDSR